VEATQTFHELASEWLEGRRRDLSVHGYTDYHWQLTNHLLPFFVRHYPLEITASEIDRLRAHLLDHGLSGTSVNKCIRLLAQILDVAEDYGLVAGNPARNRRRYAKRAPKAPVWLDRPEQIEALLEAAARLDASPSSRTHGREAFIAVLLLAGLRIGEACELPRDRPVPRSAPPPGARAPRPGQARRPGVPHQRRNAPGPPQRAPEDHHPGR